MSVRVIVARTKEEKNYSYRMRYRIMCEELGWLSVQEHPDWVEQDEYDHEQSVSFLAMDGDENVLGTSRLILAGALPLPVERHFELYPGEEIERLYGDLAFCAEASRFIVPRHSLYRCHEITIGLVKKMMHKCTEMDIHGMLMSVDYRFFRLLRMLGLPIYQIGIPKEYMGSKTIPGVFPFAHIESMTKFRKPDLYSLLSDESAKTVKESPRRLMPTHI